MNRSFWLRQHIYRIIYYGNDKSNRIVIGFRHLITMSHDRPRQAICKARVPNRVAEGDQEEHGMTKRGKLE